MNTQPEALRLADELEKCWADPGLQVKSAAELRRLHALNDDLLEALKDLLDNVPPLWECAERAQDAIAKAEGQT